MTVKISKEKVLKGEHDADYLSMVHSLVMTEFWRLYRQEGRDGKAAHLEAVKTVADAIGRNQDEFRQWYLHAVTEKGHRGMREKLRAKLSISLGEKSTPEIPEEIAAVTDIIKDSNVKDFPVPEIKTAVEDPFATDEIVDKLVQAFKNVKIGVPVYQTYPTHNHAKTAGSLINRVSHRLKWKQYKKIVDGCILWVKRTK